MIMGRVSQTTAVGAAALLVLGFMFHVAGLRVNVTRSIPIGLYRVTDAQVEKGEYVIFCPQNRRCLMKRAAADTSVRVSARGAMAT